MTTDPAGPPAPAVVGLRERPDLLEIAIDYITEQWAGETTVDLYRDCLTHSLTTRSPLPQWFLLLSDDGAPDGASHAPEPIGCVGLITNDFISRMDLWPWLVALYVDPEHRGRNHAAALIAAVRQASADAGFPDLHLATDHVGFYEKHGFTYVADGHHPWGETSRIYQAPTGL